jgi:hypothetical protein
VLNLDEFLGFLEVEGVSRARLLDVILLGLVLDDFVRVILVKLVEVVEVTNFFLVGFIVIGSFLVFGKVSPELCKSHHHFIGVELSGALALEFGTFLTAEDNEGGTIPLGLFFLSTRI